MFRIKICGITNVDDAVTAVGAGADAIGLNFYEKSPRYISDDAARSIAKATGNSTHIVGVFVNEQSRSMLTKLASIPLSAIQLHGDESPRVFTDLPVDLDKLLFVLNAPLRIVRARRLDDRGVAAISGDLADWHEAGCPPSAVLVDSLSPGRYGGTGETVSWVGLADHRRWLGDTPLILAGGLTPDNVAEAIRIVRPHGVDVASGVESAPGKKDPHKVRDFIAAARAALDALPTSSK